MRVSTVFLIAVFCLLLLPAGSVKAELVSHWTFDGTLADAGPGGNDGTMVGTEAYTEGFDGTADGAIALDGASLVQVAQNTKLPAYHNAAFTIAMWVKGAKQKDKRIFSEASSADNNPLFNLGTDNTAATGKFDFFFRPRQGQILVNHRKSDREPFDGTWHHVAWVDEGGTVVLYIDGVRDSVHFDYNHVEEFAANTTTIGGILRATACCFFTGAIDDVRFYDHALTAEEVKALIPEADTCPDAGDTHITDVAVDAPPFNLAGVYSVTVTASDESGDPILYTISLEDSQGNLQQVGPGGQNTASFAVGSGTWTLKVSVDDDLFCHDQADDATQEIEITVDDSPRLITHLTFDGTLADSGDGGNDGSILPAADATYTEGFDGTENGAIALDGTALVDLAHNGGLPIYTTTQAYTVAMWVKGESQQDMRVFAEASTLNNGPLVNIGTTVSDPNNPAYGKVKIYMRGSHIYTANSERVAFDGTWHHIAWVDEGGKAVMYIDGIRDPKDFTYTHPLLSVNTTSVGGIHRAATSHFFTGAIDDVRIYNYALSEEEILDLIPEPPDCPDEGDTHCNGITVEGPEGGVEGLYTVTADATDDSGDEELFYTFVVTMGETRIQKGPQTENTAEFNLTPGMWELTVTVDDDLACRDRADDAVCTETVTVLAEPPIMISRWAMDGDLNDAQPAGNNGVLVGYELNEETEEYEEVVGTPAFGEGVDCTAEGAIVLGGEDAKQLVKVTPNAGLPLTAKAAFSVAMWVKGLPQPDKRVFSESSSQTNNLLYNIGTDNTGATGAVDIYIRGNDNTVAVNHAKSTGIAFDGTWHHIAWVDNEGQGVLYIDGVRDATDFTYTRPVMEADTTTIGGILREGRLPAGHPACCFFEGMIDDVRIFNYPLTEEDVQALYGDGPAHCCPEEGDTHCTGLEVTGDGKPGAYTTVCTAVDDSGDDIIYYFTADNGTGTVLEVGPQPENTAEFQLTEGTWTITVTVDDDPLCDDAADDAECSQMVEVGPAGTLFVRGDTNADGKVDIADAICVLGYLFGGPEDPCKNSVPLCMDAADANDDEGVDIADAVKILGHLFSAEGPLPPPFGECGLDPEGEGLGCENFNPCSF